MKTKKRQIFGKPRPGMPKGDPDLWRRLAEARLGLDPAHTLADDLTALGLAVLPATLADLKRAYRAAMRLVHSDLVGGTDDAAIKTGQAYRRLQERLK